MAPVKGSLSLILLRERQVERSEVVTILETFSGVRRKDEQIYGFYRTKDLILEIYDAMDQARRSKIPYQTPLDPPPGDPRISHSAT